MAVVTVGVDEIEARHSRIAHSYTRLPARLYEPSEHLLPRWTEEG